MNNESFIIFWTGNGQCGHGEPLTREEVEEVVQFSNAYFPDYKHTVVPIHQDSVNLRVSMN